jgi:hypothetical protein
MTRAAFPTLRRRAAQARHTQLRTLARLQAFDDAVAQHMTHGAMAGADPLTDSLYGQLEALAAEGGLPATPYPAGQAPQREHRGWWLTGITLLAALVSLALLTPGASA